VTTALALNEPVVRYIALAMEGFGARPTTMRCAGS